MNGCWRQRKSIKQVYECDNMKAGKTKIRLKTKHFKDLGAHAFGPRKQG